MKIKFGDFRLSDTAKKSVFDVLDSNWLSSSGNKVREFELAYSEYFNYPYTRMLSSGTAACTTACMCLYQFGANIGDEVLTSALSFIATSEAIKLAGFTPVFVDVDWNLQVDYTLIEEKITPKTRAIIVPTLMGKCPNLEEIQKIAKEYGLIFIVDNCEGIGLKYKDKRPLEYSDFEAMSFYVAHCLTVGMDAGALSCNTEYHDFLIEAIRSHGRMHGNLYFDHPIWGGNWKSNNIAAAIAIENLKELEYIINKRLLTLKRFQDICRPYQELIWFTDYSKDEQLSPHAFSITFKPNNRGYIQKLQGYLDGAEIEWKRNFGSIPTHGAFAYLGAKPEDCPKAYYIGNNGLHIGVNQYLSSDQISYVGEKLSKFFANI